MEYDSIDSLVNDVHVLGYNTNNEELGDVPYAAQFRTNIFDPDVDDTESRARRTRMFNSRIFHKSRLEQINFLYQFPIFLYERYGDPLYAPSYTRRGVDPEFELIQFDERSRFTIKPFPHDKGEVPTHPRWGFFDNHHTYGDVILFSTNTGVQVNLCSMYWKQFQFNAFFPSKEDLEAILFEFRMCSDLTAVPDNEIIWV